MTWTRTIQDMQATVGSARRCPESCTDSVILRTLAQALDVIADQERRLLALEADR